MNHPTPPPTESQSAFIARGLAARDEARATGNYFSKEEVMASLRRIVEAAKAERATVITLPPKP